MNNQMMMTNSNNQMMMYNNMNNQMMINNNNNQMMMNNSNNQMVDVNNNQINNNKMKELLEELDYMRNKVNLYEKRIKTLEERIKEKDSEIINLKNRLSSNFYYNQNLQQFNYNQSPMMMGQINYSMMSSPAQGNNSKTMEKKNSPKYLTYNFIFDGHIIGVQGNPKMTIEKLIKNFGVKLCIDNFSGDYFFKGKKLDEHSNYTLETSGISNKDDILVFDQNDKNQKECISKILSHKHDNIKIIFNGSTGHKVEITIKYYTRISKICKLYCKQLRLKKDIIGKKLMFLHNGQQLEINDNRIIEEISEGGNTFSITVYDLGGIIGA
jgi:hypothetical protein